MERKWYKFREEYEVSNLGEVRSLDRIMRNGKQRKGKLLKPQFVGDYLGVYLTDPETGKQKWEYIHRLVAQAFIPNPDNLPMINHKDCVPTNNRVDNLEWCDAAYNTRYSLYKRGIWDDFTGLTEEEIKEQIKEKRKAYRKAHFKPKMSHTVYIYKPIFKITYELVGEYKNTEQAAKAVKMSSQSISNRLSKQSLKPLRCGYVVSREKIA